MRLPRLLLLPTALLALAACAPADPPQATVDANAIANGLLGVEPWPLPLLAGTAQPDLSRAHDGRLLLSWIDSRPGTRPALRMVEYAVGGGWQPQRTVALGNSLVVNWADTPHVAATADRTLWTQWLQKTGDSGHAYDVYIARSLNHGMNWTAPQRVHNDGTVSEHGFVSLFPYGGSGMGVAWLDGRHVADGTTGVMTLRAAVFDPLAGDKPEQVVDDRVCDCCKTDTAQTDRGVLLVYRDRTAEEIRDISVSRFDGIRWTAPRRVHADDWKMPACPVNGPAVAARGNDAVVGWYTAAGNVSALKLARSRDAGDSFGKPVIVDRGPAVLGRVDVALDAGQAWVLWLREENGAQSLWLARYAPDLSRELQRIEVARLQAKGRASGFPKLALRDGGAYVVWTDMVEGGLQVRGARVHAGAATTAANR